MTPARFTAWTLLVVAGFALLAPSTTNAQPPDAGPLPQKSRISKYIPDINAWRTQVRGGIPKEDLKKAREAFKAFATYYADVVKHPEVWKWSQDPKVLKLGEAPPPTLEGDSGLFKEIDRFLLEPGNSRDNLEPADYIREMGVAFDAAFKPLIEEHPEMIVRINAARVLAHVARTGAPAHFPTVTALLANANTPAGVKNYLFVAAGALLAAPDVYEPKVRRHAADAKTVGALVKALQDCIDDPAMLVPGVSLNKPETLTEDQLLVVGYLRRQAVRALGQTKFGRVPGPGGPDDKPLYPAYTLVRVAMADRALVPEPGPAEAAEAAIGLCNMAPIEEQLKGGFRQIKEYNGEVAVEAVTAALVTFAKPRAANPADRTLPWRLYATRLGEALRNWRPLFDPEFESVRPDRFDTKLIPPGVEALNREVVPTVLAPMDKVDFMGVPIVGARVDIEGLQARLTKLRNQPNRPKLLFTNVPATTIEFPPPKKPVVKEPPKKEPDKKGPPKKEPEKK